MEQKVINNEHYEKITSSTEKEKDIIYQEKLKEAKIFPLWDESVLEEFSILEKKIKEAEKEISKNKNNNETMKEDIKKKEISKVQQNEKIEDFLKKQDELEKFVIFL